MRTWNEEIYHEMLSPYKGGTVNLKDPKVDLKNGIYYTYLLFKCIQIIYYDMEVLMLLGAGCVRYCN